MSTKSVSAAAERLLANLTELGSCMVAFSGGVDSAVVAKAAHLALGERAMAVTGVSASLAQGELETAERIAQAIGIGHLTVQTEELDDDAYLANLPNRCWHCKDELYSQLLPVAKRHQLDWIVNGANVDDLGEVRPGMKAAAEHNVRSPLAECKIDKATVRELALHWQL